MSPTERLRQILPFAAALYLAASVAHLQAKQPGIQLPREGLSLHRVVAGIKWHITETAKYERATGLFAFPGN
ncbi:hypothetical protein [Methylobacterium gnaphalii]|uniref:Uncharacterized protein n=1 Tax=Methylobacterium gnaphalii TaxID=1010610 RepID=A0A512JGU6_9HYPH|nr:hypothetical protein [Methylobacterium gnaphalii]GEP09072.1 hypothetical protein MGN01_09170 [Methylobacterium gnaphalii]GJD68384.1 hypothetical protein MMMDOFMJ_1307 [Methylobacterium gnaphalii]GLS48996.1 hypothetical protein GCM10007885_18430 [Methylobacterium gnaphalii]